MKDIYTDVRSHKDHFFKSHPQSPLTPDQKRNFQGLVYFPVNEDLRFELELEETEQRQHIEMQTSTGDTQEYIRMGIVRFEVEGSETRLAVYANEHGYFLPFVDSLAGTETYPAGRYLEPEPTGNGKLLIDFNTAYNPYCAYNDLWSCPLTPFENRIKVPIRAGEKIFSVHD